MILPDPIAIMAHLRQFPFFVPRGSVAVPRSPQCPLSACLPRCAWLPVQTCFTSKRMKWVGIGLLVAVVLLFLWVFLGAIFGLGGIRPNTLSVTLILCVVAFWVWMILAVGSVAASKGYSKAGFIIFAIFLPVVALIVALVLQPSQSKQTAAVSAKMVKCPACAELIQPEAIKCKHCGEMIGSTPATEEA